MLTDAIDAVVTLNPQPRQRRWTSLAYCVLDAVWSIGARYDTVVVPLVRRVAEAHGDHRPTVPAADTLPPDPLPLPALLARFPSADALVPCTNAQRTLIWDGSLPRRQLPS